MQSGRQPAVGHNQEAAFRSSCSNTRRPAARTPKAASCSADGREFCWPPRRAYMAKNTLAHTHAHAQTYIHTHMRAHVSIHLYTRPCMQTYVYIYVYMYIGAQKRLSAAQSGCPLRARRGAKAAVRCRRKRLSAKRLSAVRCPKAAVRCRRKRLSAKRLSAVRCPKAVVRC